MISEARSEISNTQRVADQAVHNVVLEARSHISEAQAQAQSTETKAQAYVNELKAKHQKELEEVQRVAQRVHDDYQVSQNQSSMANDKINELLHTIGRQSEDLERQRKERSGLTQIDSAGSRIATSSDIDSSICIAKSSTKAKCYGD